MPGFNGSGPFGTGPNGRGLGPCGRGRAFGRGGFFSREGYARRGPWPDLSPEEEKQDLENQKSWLASQLDSITKRLSELNK